MNWISIEKEQPKDKLPFLGTDGDIIFAAYWCNDSEDYKVGGWEACWYCGGSSKIKLKREYSYEVIVTHWMPLPKMPG